jgi:hypothetical protein
MFIGDDNCISAPDKNASAFVKCTQPLPVPCRELHVSAACTVWIDASLALFSMPTSMRCPQEIAPPKRG